MNFGDISELSQKLVDRNDKSFKNGEYWQAVLNLGFAWWRLAPSGIGYADMIEWTRLSYGPFAQLCILLGKYNQQTTNNGHAGYWDNGFAGGRSGDPDEDIPLHKDMMRLMTEFGLDKTPLGEKVYGAMGLFEIHFPDPYDDCDCCEDDDYPRLKTSKCDDEYFAVAAAWEKFFGKAVRKAIEAERKKAA